MVQLSLYTATMQLRRIIEAEIHLHAFLVSTLIGGKWAASRCSRSSPWKKDSPVFLLRVWADLALDLYMVTKKLAPPRRMELLSYDHISSVSVPVSLDVYFIRQYVGTFNNCNVIT